MFKIRRFPQLGPSRESVWSAFAGENGGRYSAGGLTNPSTIVLIRNGFEIQVEAIVYSAPQGGARNTYVRIHIDFPTGPGEYLSIYPKGLFDFIWTLFSHSTSVGNRKLDAQFRFKASDANKLRDLFFNEQFAAFLLSDPSTIINVGKVQKSHTPNPPRSGFVLERIGDIRTKEKLAKYIDFCVAFVRAYQQ